MKSVLVVTMADGRQVEGGRFKGKTVNGPPLPGGGFGRFARRIPTGNGIMPEYNGSGQEEGQQPRENRDQVEQPEVRSSNRFIRIQPSSPIEPRGLNRSQERYATSNTTGKPENTSRQRGRRNRKEGKKKHVGFKEIAPNVFYLE